MSLVRSIIVVVWLENCVVVMSSIMFMIKFRLFIMLFILFIRLIVLVRFMIYRMVRMVLRGLLIMLGRVGRKGMVLKFIFSLLIIRRIVVSICIISCSVGERFVWLLMKFRNIIRVVLSMMVSI